MTKIFKVMILPQFQKNIKVRKKHFSNLTGHLSSVRVQKNSLIIIARRKYYILIKQFFRPYNITTIYMIW